MPSSSLTTAPSFVTYDEVEYLGLSYTGTLNASGRLANYSPARIMYAAADSSNNVHLYGMDLTSTGVPAAHQISSLSIPLPNGEAVYQVICNDSDQGQTNVSQPDSLFLVVHLPGSSGCNLGGDTYEVVSYTDSASTAPHAVSITTGGITELYTSAGVLSGIELFDGTNSNVDVYPYTVGTTPMTSTPVHVLTGVSGASEVDEDRPAGAAEILDVTFSANSSIHNLYRLPVGSTTASVAFTESAAGAINDVTSDLNNLYFIDSTVSGTTTTQTVYQLPLASGSSSTLFGPSAYTSTTGQSLRLIGSNGSVVMVGGVSTAGSVTTENFYGLPVGMLTSALSSSPPSVAGPANGSLSVDFVPRTAGDITTSVALVTWESGTLTAPVFNTAILSAATTPAVLQNTLANSAFLEGSAGTGGNVVQVRGVTDTGGTLGGGSLYNVNLSSASLTSTIMTNAGSAYSIPAGGTPFLYSISNSVGMGEYDTSGVGLAFDLSKNYIVPIAVNNTSITAF